MKITCCFYFIGSYDTSDITWRTGTRYYFKSETDFACWYFLPDVMMPKRFGLGYMDGLVSIYLMTISLFPTPFYLYQYLGANSPGIPVLTKRKLCRALPATGKTPTEHLKIFQSCLSAE